MFHLGKFVCLSVAMSLLVACAGNSPARLNTASGKPEIFINSPVSAVKNDVAQICAERGGMLESMTDNIAICAIQDSNIMRNSILQLAIGNQYSTVPLIKTQFTYTPQQNGTKVYVQMWAETQMAFGQMRRVPLNNGNLLADIQSGLQRMKQRLEKNTSMPNHSVAPTWGNEETVLKPM